MQSEIFFFISSIGFIILFGMFFAILFYVLKAIKSFSSMLEKMEKSVDFIGEEAKKLFEEMLEEMRDNVFFKFFFGRKKKRKKKEQ